MRVFGPPAPPEVLDLHDLGEDALVEVVLESGFSEVLRQGLILLVQIEYTWDRCTG